MGNVAVGTKFGNGSLHVDGKKDNTSTSASTTQMLNDFLVHPTGRVYIGAKPNDVLLFIDKEDKIKVAANVDLDVDYDLATTSNSQAIVHRNIISSGTMDNRGARGTLSSITAFEGHTYQTPTLLNGMTWYQQRASIVLRTGRTLADGGEIWFGTAGTTTYSGANAKQAWYRAVMDEKGYWAFGADPNGESYSPPSERLDVLYGGLRLRQINSAAYTSTNSADKIVVVDANGVLKTRTSTGVFNSKNENQALIKKINSNTSISSNTTLVDATNSSINLDINSDQEVDGNQLIIKKIDKSNHSITIKSSSNKTIDLETSYSFSDSLSGVTLQYFDNNWYVISKF